MREQKADYAFAFSTRHYDVASAYNELRLTRLGYALSQTTDAFTKRIALFSGIEVKQDDRGKKEALAQLSI
jgi:hypothetical protein